jgi:hypothetical protein
MRDTNEFPRGIGGEGCTFSTLLDYGISLIEEFAGYIAARITHEFQRQVAYARDMIFFPESRTEY